MSVKLVRSRFGWFELCDREAQMKLLEVEHSPEYLAWGYLYNQS
ncbi:MAG TPA: hypothetical protein V6C85_23485 [Allocoleopsis sp.]